MSDIPGVVEISLGNFLRKLRLSDFFNFQIRCEFYGSQKTTPEKDLNCLDMARNWLTDMLMKTHLEE